MDKQAGELLARLYKSLKPQQIDTLKAYSTQTKIVYAEAFLVRNRELLEDRPENQDLEIPASVQLIRLIEMASQKLDRIEAKQSGFFRSIGNIFSFGKGEFESRKSKK